MFFTLSHPKTKEQYTVTFDEEQYISQCGILILANLQISQNKKYLKMHPKEAAIAFTLLEKYLFHNEVGLTQHSYTSPLFNEDYDDKPICARVLLSDVTNNKGPYMTGMFAEFLKLPSAGTVTNPNTDNVIDLWWYDMPQKDEYSYKDDYDVDADC